MYYHTTLCIMIPHMATALQLGLGSRTYKQSPTYQQTQTIWENRTKHRKIFLMQICIVIPCWVADSLL